MVEAKTLHQLDNYKAVLDQLESDVVYRWIDSSIVIDYFQLRSSFSSVNDTYERMRKRLAGIENFSTMGG